MDTVSKKRRSLIMKSVRSEGTGLENEIFKVIRRAGFGSFVKHPHGLAGNPDLIFKRQHIAVFIDSCFWHGCAKHCRRPSSNIAYWDKKITANMKRDERVRRALRNQGWSVLRIWEHNVENPNAFITRLKRAIRNRSK